MYFKRLELIGFKSFLDKTTLNFEPGITAIVGPNGCGKSNIFDSIRWVLGEQSVKSLRGSQMEDVIFNGTDLKEPLGMAEVSLTFDNDKRYFSVDHNEVVITRRIFRSGESEYLLNKTQVRLKDILELLMGTGIGAENYSLVEQGKIGLILSSRPEDRRLIFDEAAGITKYKAQKKEALRKLEETEQNLLRVNDIVTEVKRQIGSLERQANKARRYKEVFEELKTKEVSLAVLEKSVLGREKDNIIIQLNELQSEEMRLLALIQEHESRIGTHRADLKAMEDSINAIKGRIMNLDNTIVSNEERINFNKEKGAEQDGQQKYLAAQIEQTKKRLELDVEKLNNLKSEHDSINKSIEEKTLLLNEKEARLSDLGSSIKLSLETIAKTKRNMLDLASRLAQAKNQISDLSGREQIHLARRKRLEIEKLKVDEEKALIKSNLDSLVTELKGLEESFGGLNVKLNNAKDEQGSERLSLKKIEEDIANLEKERLTLESHKEFLEKLKTKYEDISESMNAVVYLDKQPADKVTGLVIKIKDDNQPSGSGRFELSGEAKPIDLDAQKIIEKLKNLVENINSLQNTRSLSLGRIEDLNRSIESFQKEFRDQEIFLANKKSAHNTILEQFNKINEEDEIIAIELSDVDKELSVLAEKLTTAKAGLSLLDEEQKGSDELVLREQNNIDLNNKAKEEVLVVITQTKTELEGLGRRVESDQDTLKILEDTYAQDKENISTLERQIQESASKQENLLLEIKSLQTKIEEARLNIEEENRNLKETQDKYQEISSGVIDSIEKLDSDRKGIDVIKDRLYELQMQNKEADFKIAGLRERIFQAYKVDLELPCDIPQEAEREILSGEIQKLKDRLDACGTVNLVAIEEYDELKKRYDFLTQQHTDLLTAKDAVHEAILKINRTTKKMFLETFEKVKVEFRNYFKMLFNGGDAQIFLVDEQDPLESGIEIICRPPGKKLQNVMLLSGGEKSLSATALIFAIFKIKPSPFCVLDEIDAALDEANVDRFGRMLSEFTGQSQFIVITHNKKTIANANVMYGITMQESGVSKIVSVKFAENNGVTDKEPDVAVAEPV